MRWVVVAVAAALVSLVSVPLLAVPAMADIALVQTDPADGAAVTTPVTQVTLEFSQAGEPSGDGLVLLDSAGSEVPVEISSAAGGSTWVLTPAEPLTDGTYGVTWSVRGGDSHSVSGSFSFSVAVPLPAEPTPAPAATAAAPPEGDPVDEAATDPLEAALASAEASASGSSAANLIRWFGVALSLAAGLFALGALAFLVLVMVGDREEVVAITKRVKWSGAVLVLGALLQLSAEAALIGGGAANAVPDLLGSWLGLALLLRIAGGVALLIGVAVAPQPMVDDAGPAGSRWPLVRPAAVMVGAGLFALSLLLDGHSNSESPRALVWVTDLAHVGAAAIWLGGVTCLAIVLLQRRRTDQQLSGGVLAVRFSVLATYAVALVGVAGVILAVSIMNSPSDLWDTSWGRLLLLKVVAVAAIGALGAYNHFVLLPRLQEDVPSDVPGAPEVVADPQRTGGSTATLQEAPSRHLLSTVLIEVALFVVVVAITAALVNASV